mmetsp:Transcript_35759/g.101195  ORF Transcript_35759/g.101195 Transcript_35759/m.101195 type:complete len:325 (+) Transcript_35759:335-1309(+)
MSNSDDMDVDDPAPPLEWDPDSVGLAMPAPARLVPARARPLQFRDPPMWMLRLNGRSVEPRASQLPRPGGRAPRSEPEPAFPATIPLPEIPEAEQRALVHSYLVHHCYGRTATLLDAASGCAAGTGSHQRGGSSGSASCSGTAAASREATSPPKASAMVDSRLPIIQAVLQDKPLAAATMATELQGDIFLKRNDVLFDLTCLEYIKLVRKGCVEEAIAFAQKELSSFGHGDSSQVGKLEECLALLAYDNPAASPLGSYLSDEHRQGVADALNGALLQAADLPSRAPLERIAQQLTVASDVVASLSGGGGAQRFRFDEWIRSVDT